MTCCKNGAASGLSRLLCSLVILIGAALLVIGPSFGCSASALRIEAATASAVAEVANLGLPILTAAYEQEINDAIVDAAGKEDLAATRERRPSVRGPAMDAAEAAVVLHWAPVWSAWSVLRFAHGTWAVAIETGTSGGNELAQMTAAYCDFAAIVPAKLKPALGSVVGVACPVVVSEVGQEAQDAWRSADGGIAGQDAGTGQARADAGPAATK
jgi:hypothetical protein